MRDKNGLRLTILFSPLLALVIGIALLLRTGADNEVGSRLHLIDMAVDEVFDLDIACQRYLLTGDDFVLQDWQKRCAAITILFSTIKVDGQDETAIYQKVRRNLERMEELVVRVKLGPRPPGRDIGSDNPFTEALRLSKAIVTGTVMMAGISHGNTVVAQQHADMLIIVFSAIIAILMAVSAYMTARDELGRRKEMARELEQSNMMLSDAFVKLHRAEQGIYLERLQALESMAQGLGYEIGANLAPIVRVSDTLLNYPEYIEDREKMRAGLVSISKSARSAKESIERLTQFVNAAKSDGPRAIDVAHLVDDVLASCRTKLADIAAHGISIVIKRILDESNVEGYESELRESLIQLVVNALESMPRGGTLTFVSARHDEHVSLSVCDTGRGMSEEVIHHCCEPFFSTKGDMASGMGLTIVAGTVRRHGGQLDIQSQPGMGTTVKLILPARIPVEPDAPTKAADIFEVASLKILVVDDQPWVGQTLNDLLTADGHRVECADCGQAGLRKLRTGGFDLLITDRAMPDMNGEQLAEVVRRDYPAIRIILLTGFGEIIKDSGVSSHLVDLVLSKPITQNTLRRGIYEALHKPRTAGMSAAGAT